MSENEKTSAVAATLIFTSWGLYYSFTRRYLSVELEGGTRLVMLIAGLEWFFTLFAVLSADLSGRIGIKRTILAGMSGSTLFIIATRVKDATLLALTLALSSFTWSLSWPAIVSAILSKSASPGKTYSIFTIGSGAGYSLGSITMGFSYEIAGSEGVLLLISLLYALGYFLLLILIPDSRELSGDSVSRSLRSIASMREIFPILIGFSLTVLSRELFYSVAPSKLTSDIRTLFPSASESFERSLFGVFFGGLMILLSMPSRYLAGVLADRYDPLKILIITNLSYLTIYWLFIETVGLIPIVLWQIPLYPFLDVSINTYIVKRSSRELVTLGLGVVLLFTAVGGLLQLAVLASSLTDPVSIGVVITTAISISTAILVKTVRSKT
ncbi:MAG: MFS transporter [Sulfolobales archaeon]